MISPADEENRINVRFGKPRGAAGFLLRENSRQEEAAQEGCGMGRAQGKLKRSMRGVLGRKNLNKGLREEPTRQKS